MATVPSSVVPGRRAERAGFAVFVALAVGLLVWAKWWPYSVKIPKTADTHTLGSSIITGKGAAPPVRRVFPAKVLAATVGAVIALGLLTAGTAALMGL